MPRVDNAVILAAGFSSRFVPIGLCVLCLCFCERSDNAKVFDTKRTG